MAGGVGKESSSNRTRRNKWQEEKWYLLLFFRIFVSLSDCHFTLFIVKYVNTAGNAEFSHMILLPIFTIRGGSVVPLLNIRSTLQTQTYSIVELYKQCLPKAVKDPTTGSTISPV